MRKDHFALFISYGHTVFFWYLGVTNENTFLILISFALLVLSLLVADQFGIKIDFYEDPRIGLIRWRSIVALGLHFGLGLFMRQVSIADATATQWASVVSGLLVSVSGCGAVGFLLVRYVHTPDKVSQLEMWKKVWPLTVLLIIFVWLLLIKPLPSDQGFFLGLGSLSLLFSWFAWMFLGAYHGWFTLGKQVKGRGVIAHWIVTNTTFMVSLYIAETTYMTMNNPFSLTFLLSLAVALALSIVWLVQRRARRLNIR